MRAAAATLIPLLLFSGPALAEITAEDVWANMTAEAQALGIGISAAPERVGQELRIGPVVWSYVLPRGAGMVELRSDGPALQELDDGRVGIALPDRSTLGLHLDFSAAGESLSADLTFLMTVSGETFASGTPGEISYESAFETLEFSLAGLTGTENGLPVPDLDKVQIDAFFRLAGLTAQSTVTAEGSSVTAVSQSHIAEMIYDLSLVLEGETRSHSVGQITDTATETSRHLPGTPPDLMNLAPALRAGLSLQTESRSALTLMQSIDTWDGGTVNQSQSITETLGTARLDASGLAFSTTSAASVLDMTTYMLPVRIRLDTGPSEIALALPLLAAAETQPARLSLHMAEVVPGEELMALADPGGTPPRDPLTLGFDLLAHVLISRDLVDIPAMEAAIGRGESPVDLRAVAFDNLDIAALGARLTGLGTFNVDLSDTLSHGGEPRFDGTASLDLSGSATALSALVTAGLIPPEALTGVRMGLAFLFKPQSDGNLHAEITTGFDGSITANGQQIR